MEAVVYVKKLFTNDFVSEPSLAPPTSKVLRRAWLATAVVTKCSRRYGLSFCTRLSSLSIRPSYGEGVGGEEIFPLFPRNA